jgi:hypothetical protein
MKPLAPAAPLPTTALKLFTFCFYIGKNTYHELVHMLYVLIASLERFHPDFFLVVYHNLGIMIDDPRVMCRRWDVKDGGSSIRPLCGGMSSSVTDRDLFLDADGCDGNVWVEGSAVRNRWHQLSFNKIHVFKNLYDEYDGECFTWIDLDTVVVADLSYLGLVDNYFVMHGGRGGEGGGGGDGGERMHEVLLNADDSVRWSIPERLYIQGSFWKLNLSLYHEVLRLDLMFRENGVKLKYDLQSIFAVMAGGPSPYDGLSELTTVVLAVPAEVGVGVWGVCPPMNIIGYNFRPDVMNGLGVWDTKDSVGNHVNTDSLVEMRWEGSAGVPPPNDGPEPTIVSEPTVDIDRRLKLTANDGGGDGGSGGGGVNGGVTERSILRTSLYPDKEIHILSLTFDSFFMSNVSGSSDFARLFPFLLV